MLYLSLVAVLVAVCLCIERARPLGIVLSVNMMATIILQDFVSYHSMMYADALTFNVMVIVTLWRPNRYRWVASALMGLSCVAHLAYYGMGEDRHAYRYLHMYALQAVYLASVVAALLGGFDVKQFLASLLDRLRGVCNDAPRLGWARRSDYSSPQEKA